MKNPHKLWMDLAERFAQQSKCRSRQVGCVLVTEDQRMIGQGFNGAPAHSACESCPRCSKAHESGERLDLAICAHAEANLLGYAARAGIPTNRCILYCTTKPCVECTKLIVAAGIAAVYYRDDYPSPRGLNHNDMASEMLYLASIPIIRLTETGDFFKYE